MIEKLYSKIEKNKFLKILIACGGFLFVCIFISFKAHAETVGSSTIPYNVSQMASYNEMMVNEYMEIAYNRLIELSSQYNWGFDSDDSYLVWTQDGFYNRSVLQYYFMFSPYCNESYTSDRDYLTNTLRFSSTYEIYYVAVDIEGYVGGVFEPHTHYADLCGNATSVTTSRGSYLPRYPFFYNGEPILDTNGNVVLIANGNGSLVTGSSVAPNFGAGAGTGGSDFLGTGADFGASISQATMPSAPTYNTYNFTTFNPPSFDDSSILDALSSIADILQYLGSYLIENITGALNNISSNIQALGQYIGGIIEYVGRSIITNIQNGIQNLFENITNLFEPLLNSINELIDSINQKLDYISQPFDASVIQDSFESTALHSDIDSISQFTDTAFGIFDSTNEPNEFKIPLHLENIALLNISQVQYIDLGCINPVKTAIRAVMWCLTTFSLLYTVIDAIPSYINGGDE